MQADLVYSLYRVRPNALTVREITERLYLDEVPPKNALGTIRHLVSKLRPKLALLGMSITSLHNEGYRLDIPED
jgi:DNA-binding SARP family transcriptional activator